MVQFLIMAACLSWVEMLFFFILFFPPRFVKMKHCIWHSSAKEEGKQNVADFWRKDLGK